MVATLRAMKSVGIKDLKNQLSRYLKLVREGETVFVTDREEVVAEFHRPTTPARHNLSRWDCFLNDLERSRSLRRAKRHGPIVRPSAKPSDPEIPWREILSDVRRDRSGL